MSEDGNFVKISGIGAYVPDDIATTQIKQIVSMKKGDNRIDNFFIFLPESLI